MSHDYDTLILLNGLVKVLVWGYGSCLATYRRRGMLALGFGGACAITALRALADAQLPLSEHVGVVAYAGGPVAGLIVASFIGRQPRNAPRPRHWTF